MSESKKDVALCVVVVYPYRMILRVILAILNIQIMIIVNI